MAEDEITEMESLRRDVAELRRQIDAVRRIAAAVSTAYGADEVVRQALDVSLELADSDAGSILVFRPAREKLVFEYVVGDKSAELTGVELDPDEGLAGRVFQTGRTSVSDDVTKEGAHLREIGERVGYKTHNMVTTPLKSADARPLGVMQVLNKRDGAFDEFDVALIEIMAAQIALAIENARLHEEARLAAVVRMIGDISHDVKNMVTAPVTGAQTLRDIANDCFARFDECTGQRRGEGFGPRRVASSQDASSESFAPAALEEAKQALADLRALYPEMIEMILDGCEAVQQRMAEISAAVKGIVSKPSFQPADVTAIARLVETMLRAQANKKGITLSVEPVGEVPLAIVDSKQISNAIYNLIFNAVDACDKGDSVTFRISAAPDGEFPDGGFVLMECADTGPGIPEHVKAKLFTDDAVSTKPMGTGLGTRIVKNVIDAHGGAIEVESEPGAGTSIRCRIPVTRE
jgi:signal transduction histidine kinase